MGATIDLNGTTFAVVGFVRAPLGGQTADVYVPLEQLQKLSSQTGQVNVVLVRADSGDDVASVQENIENEFPSAQVASARVVADRISGSLVDAASLSHRLGVALAVLAALTAFLIALLLTLSSVGKRVREIGTLKALGWKQRVVVRQIVGESLAQGVVGGLVGVVLGVGFAALIGAVGPTLTASSSTGGGGTGSSDSAPSARGPSPIRLPSPPRLRSPFSCSVCSSRSSAASSPAPRADGGRHACVRRMR